MSTLRGKEIPEESAGRWSQITGGVEGDKPQNGSGTNFDSKVTINTTVKTKFGKSPQGSYGSYQLSITEDNFKVFCDISTVPRVDSANSNDLQIMEFPRFPLNQSNEQFEIPAGISGDERSY